MLNGEDIIDTTCNVKFKPKRVYRVFERDKLCLYQGSKDLTGSLNSVESKLILHTISKLRFSDWDYKQKLIKE